MYFSVTQFALTMSSTLSLVISPRPLLLGIPLTRTRLRVTHLVNSAPSNENSVPLSSNSTLSPTTDNPISKSDSPIENSIADQLKLLYDDGSGHVSARDYLKVAREMIGSGSRSPRWFFPLDCGRPIPNSPVLMFLPGLDGVGLGLILHHKALGKVFDVRCLQIPVFDRTPFEGLLKFVENAVRLEHAASPKKPIYLVGDSFGGCLALAVAARNPTVDLLLLLINPATSFDKSPLQPLLPILKSMPDALCTAVSSILIFNMGDLMKIGMASAENGLPPLQEELKKFPGSLSTLLPCQNDLPPLQALMQLPGSLSMLLPSLSSFPDIISKDTLLWKLKLLKSAASYANSHLHAVKAEVLVLASEKDNILPSRCEAERLWTTLQNCRVRYFNGHGHTLLLENGIDLLAIIKGTNLYRRARKHNHISDFLPPSIREFNTSFSERLGPLGTTASPVMFSTLEDGKIVKGLTGIPNEGPILLIGNHMLLGLETFLLAYEFLREKNVLVRGIAHPEMFSKKSESLSPGSSQLDICRMFGAVPVSASNLYKLFSTKSFVLLYPGGTREALHRKGEEYKLFWPDQPEFVRMAAQFGATIIPFGVVGEDDIAELILDYNDQMNIPCLRALIAEINYGAVRLRTDKTGEVVNQDLHQPLYLSKMPGRFYYLFGKPIVTRGRKMEILKVKEKANALYFQIKSDVERMISYLKKKREEDPFRSILQRIIYQAAFGSEHEVPTFEP